jgi:hypothetical protein
MIQTALKGLDIPYSFFDEAHTNYSGARQALLQYEQSADVKRHDVRLSHLTSSRTSESHRSGLGIAVARAHRLKAADGANHADEKAGGDGRRSRRTHNWCGRCRRSW